MSQAQKFSASFVRRPMNVALVVAGLIGSPFLLSAVSTPAAAATALGVTATSDSSTVTFTIRYGSGTPTWTRVYLDTDRIATSRFPLNGIGANYMVENTSLYRYTGSN